MSEVDPIRAKFAAALKAAREEAGYDSARKAALDMKVNPSTYNHHENGTRGIELDVAKLYAAFFNIDIGRIFDVSGLGSSEAADFESPVVSEVKMGVWKSADLDIEERTENKLSLFLPRSRSASVRRAVEVLDESVNRSIPSGWFGLYTPLDVSIEELHNKLVYVEREKAGLIEHSIRRATLMPNGTLALHADSDDRRYKQDVATYPGPEDESVRIVGRIVGKYVESDDL